MYVTEQLHHLMVKVIGEAEEREVVKNYRPSLNNQYLLVVNAVKPLNQCSVPEYSIGVVVAKDKVNMPVKNTRSQYGIPLLNIAEAEVSQVINMVVRLYYRVPVVN